MAVGGDDPPDLRAFARQRAGLVKQDSVDFAEQIQRATILHQHAALRAQRER